MISGRPAARLDIGTLFAGAALLAVAAVAWVVVLKDASSMHMTMPGASPSMKEGVVFTLQWGVMMSAMMVPGALPMVLLYRMVASRNSASERAIPVAAFAGVYLVIWMLTGIVVYGGYVTTSILAARSSSFTATTPYIIAGILAAAGIYQFTSVKHVCLRYCESPLDFLMKRWRNGYRATFAIAVKHAGYCIGCCWALMAVLVAAGSMSIAWVLAIALVVFAEKVLPRGWQTARIVGAVLITLAIAIAARPELAGSLRPPTHSMTGH